MAAKKDWMAGATKDAHGQFRDAAQRAGMSTEAFADHVIANKAKYPTRRVRQAELAKTLIAEGRKRHAAKGKMYPSAKHEG